MKIKEGFILLVVLLVFIGCAPPMLYFSKMQPPDGVKLAEFPSELEGYFIRDNIDYLQNFKDKIDSSQVFMILQRKMEVLYHLELAENRKELNINVEFVTNRSNLDTIPGFRVILKSDSLIQAIKLNNDQDTLPFVHYYKDYYTVPIHPDLYYKPVYQEHYNLEDETYQIYMAGQQLTKEANYKNGGFSLRKDTVRHIYFFNKLERYDSFTSNEKAPTPPVGYFIEFYKPNPNGDLTSHSSITLDTNEVDRIKNVFETINYNKYELLNEKRKMGGFWIPIHEGAVFLLTPNKSDFYRLIEEPLLFDRYLLSKIDKNEIAQLPPEKSSKSSIIWPLIIGMAIIMGLVFLVLYRRKKVLANEDIKQQVQTYLSQAQLPKALALLKEKSNDPVTSRTIRLIEFNYNKANKNYHSGLLTQEEYKKEEAKSVDAILALFSKG